MQAEMKIEKAHRTDASELTQLTIRSKDYWNYGAKQIEEWRDDLTIKPKYIDENQVFKLIISNKLIGFYAFQPENKKNVKLNFLFVEPEFIGKGYGKLLMNNFLERIRKMDYKKVTLDSDPNAVEFYERIGFRIVGKLKTKVKDRFLPIMEMDIKPAYNNV